jgi:hypothetical protein
VKVLTQDHNPEQEIKHEPVPPYAEKLIPPRPDRQTCHVGREPDQENMKEQSTVFHKISSMYSAPAIGLVQYGAISRNPILRYMATASFMTGSTVSRRMRW